MAVVDIVSDGSADSPFASLCHPNIKAQAHGVRKLIRTLHCCTRSRKCREEPPFRTQPWKPWPELSSHQLAELARSRSAAPLSRTPSGSSMFGEELEGSFGSNSFDVDPETPSTSWLTVSMLRTRFSNFEFRPLASEQQGRNERLTMEIFAPDRVDGDKESELVEVVEFVVAVPAEVVDGRSYLGCGC